MLKVEKETRNGKLAVKLVGTVDEHSLLSKSIPVDITALDVYCGQIDRINSHGVIGWIDCFRGLRVKGVELRFFECSPALIQQLINIKNMIPKKEIVSVVAPYFCGTGNHRFNHVFAASDLVAAELKSPKLKCPTCGADAELDDIDEEYFAFLS
jgi:hypothetical protein